MAQQLPNVFLAAISFEPPLSQSGAKMNNASKFNPSYVGVRRDVAALVNPKSRSVLDVGCSTGALGGFIKDKQGAHVLGIELSREMAAEAATRLDRVIVGDAASVILGGGLSALTFDTIIFADVLEHLVEPWDVLKESTKHVAPNGEVIASLPNVRHIDTIINLVFRGRWPLRDRGIHDRTHLRFFARKDIDDLFAQAGLVIEALVPIYRLVERPHPINRLARYLALPGLKGFLAFQYLVRARVAPTS